MEKSNEVNRVLIVESDPDVLRGYRRLLNVAFCRAVLLAAASRRDAFAVCDARINTFLIGGDFGAAPREDRVLLVELRARYSGPIVVVSDRVSFELALELEALEVTTLPKPRLEVLLDGSRLTEQGERFIALLSGTHKTLLPRASSFMPIVRLLRRLPGTNKEKFTILDALDKRSVVKAAGSMNAPRGLWM